MVGVGSWKQVTLAGLILSECQWHFDNPNYFWKLVVKLTLFSYSEKVRTSCKHVDILKRL